MKKQHHAFNNILLFFLAFAKDLYQVRASEENLHCFHICDSIISPNEKCSKKIFCGGCSGCQGNIKHSLENTSEGSSSTKNFALDHLQGPSSYGHSSWSMKEKKGASGEELFENRYANTSPCTSISVASHCLGSCVWSNGKCSYSDSSVWCGGHQAKTCALCPDGNGQAWCNGECSWSNGKCLEKSFLEGTTYDPNAGRCGPAQNEKTCDCTGNNKYCDLLHGICGNTDLHKNAQMGRNKYDCPSTVTNAGRCGPKFGGRVCDCSGWEMYCNTDSGWCGNTQAHKDAQGDEYDCPYTKTCKVVNKHKIGNGQCDKDGGYNTPECGWDGGDCCRETCVETCAHKCVSFDCKSFDSHIANGKQQIADAIINASSKEQRMAVWLMYFFEEWGYFPIDGLNEAFKATKIALMAAHEYEELAKLVVRMGINHGVDKSLNLLLAREIVKTVVKGGKDVVARRMAVAVIQRTATLAASQAAKVAFMGVTTLGVGFAIAASEIAAVQVARLFGFDDPVVALAVGAGASILAGIAAGAIVGGPVGAAVGGAVGAASWLIGQGVSALFRATKGPNDNWCYITKASQIQDVDLYTYKGDDGWRWISYWKSHTSEFSDTKLMSAGNGQLLHFQLEVGEAYFGRVWYQDTIFVGKNTCGENWACLCGGSFNRKHPGQCECQRA